MKLKCKIIKFSLILAVCFIFGGMSINFAVTGNDDEVVSNIVNQYVHYIKSNQWNDLISLFNSPEDVKIDLLEYLNDDNNKKKKEGIFGVNNMKIVKIEPTANSDFSTKGQLVYDVYLDMSVNKQSEFYENGVSLHIFVMNYIDGNLLIETVYYRGLVDNSQPNVNLVPIEPAPRAIPSTIKVYDTTKKILKTLAFGTYIKDVTPNEIYTSWPTESIKANIIAQKTYAAFNVENPRYPATLYAAHVTDQWSSYQHYVEGSNQSITNTLYNYIYDVMMIRGQGPFDAQYRAGTSGVIGTQGGNILSQYGTVVLANNNYTYLDILHYYYTNMVVCQYNPYPNVIR